MDSKNVLFAIILSTIVLVVWATFFEQPIPNQEFDEKQEVQDDKLSTPTIDEQETKNEVARSDIINKTNRIKVENNQD